MLKRLEIQKTRQTKCTSRKVGWAFEVLGTAARRGAVIDGRRWGKGEWFPSSLLLNIGACCIGINNQIWTTTDRGEEWGREEEEQSSEDYNKRAAKIGGLFPVPSLFSPNVFFYFCQEFPRSRIPR